MMRSLYTGATGMVAQQLNIDVISNNLANVNTTGFKKSRAEFEDLMYQTMKIAGSITEGDNRLPVGIQVGMGVRPTAVHKFFTQGDFQNTGNALDVAVEGDGFFQVDVNGELMYTRAGSFKLNQDGTVVTANGYILQPEFAVPAETKNISISSTGHIAALDSEGQEIAGTLAQGFLEMANVEVVDEMVNMIVGQRAYEVNSKAIQTSDSMLGMAVQLKRS